MFRILNWVIGLLTLLLLTALLFFVSQAHADEQTYVTVGLLQGTSDEYRSGFITGVFHGAPYACGPSMSGEVLQAYYNLAVFQGRAKTDMNAVLVLYQLMHENGCEFILGVGQRPRT